MAKPPESNSTDEIEITAEMVEAARDAVFDREPEFLADDGGVILSDELLKVIFRAMSRMRP